MTDDRSEALLRRALAHERALQLGAATQVTQTSFGFVLLNRDFPTAQSHNFGVVTAEVPATDLVTELVRVLDDARIPYRVISVEDAHLARRLAPEMLSAGYEQSSDVLMALTRATERTARVAAEHVPFEEVRSSVEAAWRRWGMSEEGARRLADRASTYRNSCQVAHFAVRREGSFVSRCELYRRGDTAQIDSVVTDPPWEGQGFATSTVLAAAHEAASHGCDLVFLRTDADDWPQHFYRRLGFTEIGRTHWFERSA